MQIYLLQWVFCVSILVVLECALEEPLLCREKWAFLVSILVVLECALEDLIVIIHKRY